MSAESGGLEQLGLELPGMKPPALRKYVDELSFRRPPRGISHPIGPGSPQPDPSMLKQAAFVGGREGDLGVAHSTNSDGSRAVLDMFPTGVATAVAGLLGADSPEDPAGTDEVGAQYLRRIGEIVRTLISEENGVEKARLSTLVTSSILRSLRDFVGESDDEWVPLERFAELAISLVLKELYQRGLKSPVHPERARQTAVQELSAVLRGLERRFVGVPPPAFRVGISAHRIAQMMPKIVEQCFRYEIGVTVRGRKDKDYLVRMVDGEESTERWEQPGFVAGGFKEKAEGRVLPERSGDLAIELTVEMPLPLDGNLIGWCRGILIQGFAELMGDSGIPNTIHDVRYLLDSPGPGRDAVVRILQVMHLLVGQKDFGWMDLLSYERRSRTHGSIELGEISDHASHILSILNWLSLAQYFLEVSGKGGGKHYHRIGQTVL